MEGGKWGGGEEVDKVKEAMAKARAWEGVERMGEGNGGKKGMGEAEGVLPSNRKPKYQSGRSMMIARRGPRLGKGEQIQGEDRAHF